MSPLKKRNFTEEFKQMQAQLANAKETYYGEKPLLPPAGGGWEGGILAANPHLSGIGGGCTQLLLWN